MIDRLFFAAPTFCLLAAGTLAMGSAWFDGQRPAPPPARTPVVQLPLVEVTGKRTDTGSAWARTESVEPAAGKLQ